MRPLSDMPDAAGVRAVLTDIDDTVTTDGVLTARAYEAMEALHRAGMTVIAVTGRPAGWCDHIARMWPVDAVIGENGAFYFQYLRADRVMVQRFWASEPERLANRAALDALAARILAEVPGCALASDQPYRIADLAIDFCEDVPPLDPSAVDRIVELFRDAGAQAKVSSIHVNGWFGDYDKRRMADILLSERFGADIASSSIVYAGDSPNDEPMFGAFPLSVGVANILDFADRLRRKPGYVTAHRSGRGFVELANFLLEARNISPLPDDEPGYRPGPVGASS